MLGQTEGFITLGLMLIIVLLLIRDVENHSADFSMAQFALICSLETPLPILVVHHLNAIILAGLLGSDIRLGSQVLVLHGMPHDGVVTAQFVDVVDWCYILQWIRLWAARTIDIIGMNLTQVDRILCLQHFLRDCWVIIDGLLRDCLAVSIPQRGFNINGGVLQLGTVRLM